MRWFSRKAQPDIPFVEIMERAKEEIDTSGRYDYDHYSVCAVGHVFKATTGKFGSPNGGDNKKFNAVMIEVNKALGCGDRAEVGFLSDAARPPRIVGCYGLHQASGPSLEAREAGKAAIQRVIDAHNHKMAR